MTEAERYAKELIDDITQTIWESGNTVSKPLVLQLAKIAVKRIIAALEEYDTRTETYLKEEFGQNYLSAELQNMEQDFRFYNKVLIAIDNY